MRIADLAVELEVSEMTIRRDLDVLAGEGTARRIRGGAVAIGPLEFAERAQTHTREKGVIAQKLLALVPPAGAIGLDASSTVQRLARRLDDVRDLTVVTNGPDTFAVLQQHKGVTALLTGGELDRRTGSLVGPLATRAARDVVVSTLFVSAAALDAEFGSSESTLEDAEVKLAMADSAVDVVLALDSSKLGSHAPTRTFALERLAAIVTELDTDDARLAAYRTRCRLL